MLLSGSTQLLAGFCSIHLLDEGPLFLSAFSPGSLSAPSSHLHSLAHDQFLLMLWIWFRLLMYPSLPPSCDGTEVYFLKDVWSFFIQETLGLWAKKLVRCQAYIMWPKDITLLENSINSILTKTVFNSNEVFKHQFPVIK